MKNFFEVSNIIDTISNISFEKICTLLDIYWNTNGANAKDLAEAVAFYGLTLEEITMWDAA